jgi:hypothetical protein
VCDGLMALHFFAEKREVENYKKRRNWLRSQVSQVSLNLFSILETC